VVGGRLAADPRKAKAQVASHVPDPRRRHARIRAFRSNHGWAINGLIAPAAIKGSDEVVATARQLCAKR
jgi:hypothetical protein